jgi:hypothetical protein
MALCVTNLSVYAPLATLWVNKGTLDVLLEKMGNGSAAKRLDILIEYDRGE